MAVHPILVSGEWHAARSSRSFRADNPATCEKLPDEFPTSEWADCNDALNAAADAAKFLRLLSRQKIAEFLSRFAERIEARKNELVEAAHFETALPKTPRLADVELPRTTGQLRQAGVAVLDGSWATPTIDTKPNIRSMLASLGPVLIFGPNNFPFAFNGVSGGDCAAAVAAGNPVIAKAHPNHPNTSRLLAEEAFLAVRESGLPPATVQMIYDIAPDDGLRLAADPRLGAVAFTGSRAAGLRLKAAADAVGKPVYVELSSSNPIVILPGALAERGPQIADEFASSCLMASGQFCTSPGLVFLIAGERTENFVASVAEKLRAGDVGPLLSSSVAKGLQTTVEALRSAGANAVVGGQPISANRFANTLLRVSGLTFLSSPKKLQTEAFGNASLLVIASDFTELEKALAELDGNLTGGIYSDTNGSDDPLYEEIAPLLRTRVGRLLNDKMPTGVAVTAAMNHGGPFPATGHPGFTAVGIPTSLRRFAALHCYDNVRAARLPSALQNKNPNGKMWRIIDGVWSQDDVRPA